MKYPIADYYCSSCGFYVKDIETLRSFCLKKNCLKRTKRTKEVKKAIKTMEKEGFDVF